MEKNILGMLHFPFVHSPEQFCFYHDEFSSSYGLNVSVFGLEFKDI